MSRVLLLLLALCLPATLLADPRYDLDDEALAAVIDGELVSRRALDLMHAVAVKRRPETTPSEAVFSLVEDRLLAREARANYPMAALIADNKVGYAPAVQLEERVVANFQAMFAAELGRAVRAEKGGSLNGIVTARRPVTPAVWQAVFGKPRLLLEYSLDEKGRAAAAQHVLLRYVLGGKPGQVTLLDVYASQHVQGRNRLHARDAAFAMEQAQQLLERRYVRHWVAERSGLAKADHDVIVRAVEDAGARGLDQHHRRDRRHAFRQCPAQGPGRGGDTGRSAGLLPRASGAVPPHRAREGTPYPAAGFRNRQPGLCPPAEGG